MNRQVAIEFLAKTGKFKQGVGIVSDSLNTVDKVAKRVERTLFAFSATTTSVLAGSAFKAATFEREMGNVNSILQDTDKVLGRLSSSITDLATKTPTTVNELAQGAYSIASAGFTNQAQITNILEASAHAATAGLTDVNTAATAIVTVLNAYGAAAGNAANVSDLLFSTVVAGQTDFQQLAVNIGDFIGIAKIAGGTLNETLAAFSAITIATGQQARAATSLQGIYRQLIKPSEDLDQALTSLGFSSGKELVQTLGLYKGLQKLSQSVGNNETAMARLFPDVEGLNGVLAILNDRTGKTAKIFDDFNDNSKVAGSTARAQKEQMKTLAAQVSLLKTTLGALGVEFGKYLIPFLKLAVGAAKLFLGALHAIPDPVKAVLVVLTTLTAAVSAFIALSFVWSTRIALVRLAFIALQKAGAAGLFTRIIASSRTLTLALTLLEAKAGITAATLGKLGSVVGTVATALTVLPPILDGVDNFFARQNIDEATKSLIEFGRSGQFVGQITKDITKHTQGEGVKSFQDLAKAIKNVGNASTVNKMRDQFTNDVKVLDQIDKAAKNLVEGGNVALAQKIMNEFRKEAFARGVTQGEWNKAFNDYEKAIGNLDAANQAGALNSELLGDAIAGVAGEMDKAKEEADAYAESIKNLQSQAADFLSLGGLLDDIEESQKSAWEAAKKQASGYDDAADAAERLRDAQLDLEDAQAKLNRLNYVTNGQALAGTQASRDIARARQDVAKATRRVAQEQAGANEEFKKSVPTAREVINALQTQIAKYNSFQTDLATAAGRGLDVSIIRELQGMGEEGVDLAHLLATAPAKEFETLKGLLAQKVEIQSKEYQEAMDRQMLTAAAVAATGARRTVDMVLAEVKRLAPGIDAEVPNIAAALARIGAAFTGGSILPSNQAGPLNYGQYRSKDLPTSVAQRPGTKDPYGRTVRSKKFVGPLNYDTEVYSSIADSGAIVRPGFNVIQNKTKLPEYVLTAAQLGGMVRASGMKDMMGNNRLIGSKTNHWNFGDIYAADLNATIRQADQKKRMAALTGGN